MKRVRAVPLAAVGYLSSAAYLAVLGMVYESKGRPVSAACVAVIAAAVAAPVVRTLRRS